MKPTKISPALALFIIAPVFGELFSGSSPLNEFANPITFITLALLYGCGAILVRELVIRWRKGWFSLLLLGMAYGIYEEGIVVQSFFDPDWMDLGNMAVYGRVAGVNWVWAEHLTLFHALISVAASIAFVEMLYPKRRLERWVATRTWWGLNWTGFVSIYLIWELLTHYEPGWWRMASWLAVFALAGLARLVPERLLPPIERKVPPPWCFWAVGFFGLFGQLYIVYNGADNGAYPYPIAMILLLAWHLFLLWLVLRWSGNGAAWNDRHRVALINGALSLLLVLGPLTVGAQYPVMYWSHPVFLLLLWIAGNRIRIKTIPQTPPLPAATRSA
ncbi:MAG: hypothetical protein JXA21_10270 [Anaerolineae bacterium]|nr:hypothetical protein [Anaerolineae bacterium]